MADFNPRSPQGERRRNLSKLNRTHQISIHAPRRGSDQKIFYFQYGILNFNPRSPQGERQYSQSIQQ